MEVIEDRYAYLAVVVLLGIGLYGMLVLRNLAKKVIGMVIFTTAIFLFFIEGSVTRDGSAPIIVSELGDDPAAYGNPLPHVMILTAIVVGAGVLGVAFALLMRIHKVHGTLDEDEVIAQLAGRATMAGAAPRHATEDAPDADGEPATVDRAGTASGQEP